VSDQALGPDETWEEAFDVSGLSHALSAVEDDMKVGFGNAAFSFAAGDPSRPVSVPGAHVLPAFQFATPPSGAAPVMHDAPMDAPAPPQAPSEGPPQEPPRVSRNRSKRPAPVEEKPVFDPADLSTHSVIFQGMGQMLIDLVTNPRLVTDQQKVYSFADIAATKRQLTTQARGRSMASRSREKRRNLLSNGEETEKTLLNKLEDLQERLRVARQMKELDIGWTAVERQEARTRNIMADLEEPPKRRRV